MRKDHSPANAGMIRRLVLSILQQDTSVNDNLRGKRLSAGWDEAVLLKILADFSGT